MPRILALVAEGREVAEVAVIASAGGAGPAAGERVLVMRDGTEGSLGHPELDALARREGLACLDEDRPRAAEVETGSGPVTLFCQPHSPGDELVIVGAGHIARPLCELGAVLGYRVVVLDDRPEFADRERFPRAGRVLRVDFTDPFRDVHLTRRTRLVLVTRGHRYDYEALRRALRLEQPPGYIGMVGSQRRVRATLEQLVREGVERDRLAAIHAPVGLDIGAETPEEIAVAIAAELVHLRRGGSGQPLRERARVLERWIREP